MKEGQQYLVTIQKHIIYLIQYKCIVYTTVVHIYICILLSAYYTGIYNANSRNEFGLFCC
jgi:hypothetical protein